MADAERLFVNVKDYNAIDFGNFLSDEQRAAIEQALRRRTQVRRRASESGISLFGTYSCRSTTN